MGRKAGSKNKKKTVKATEDLKKSIESSEATPTTGGTLKVEEKPKTLEILDSDVIEAAAAVLDAPALTDRQLLEQVEAKLRIKGREISRYRVAANHVKKAALCLKGVAGN